MGAFTVARSTVIAAPAETVFALINDFHQWVHWSPWEGIDPALEREYTGPDAGPGASYAWRGNRKAGAGTMTITAAEPGRSVDVDLTFLKPFAAQNTVRFDIVPADSGVQVTWTMSGVSTGLPALMSRIMPMDKFVGKDFEKGLAALTARAEGRA